VVTALLSGLLYVQGSAQRKQAAEDARKAKHFQAWQTISVAAGQRGDCGRSSALVDLNRDGVPLIGVNLSGAVLLGITLTNVNLYHSDVSDTLISQANLEGASFALATARRAQLADSNLRNTSFQLADLSDAGFENADLAGTDFSGAILADANFLNVKNWRQIKSLKGADITGTTNAPPGFVEWALSQGATIQRTAPKPVSPPAASPPTATPVSPPALTPVRKALLDKFRIDHPTLAFTNDVRSLR
jgi:uncharacterized protein YjbI with pentapeptide repeats